MNFRNTVAAVIWLEIGAAGAAMAAAAAGSPFGLLNGKLAEGSVWDQVWSVPTLYSDEANPVLQELAFQGQLQTQYAYGSDASGSFGSGDMPEGVRWGDLEVRRFRLGLKARLWHALKFHSIVDLDADFSPHFYKDIAETYLSYSWGDALCVSVGKTELKFTREQELSSKEYLTFERSQLVNQFYGGELTGVWLAGKGIAGGWLYELGVYGNDRQDEWTELDGGAMILAKAGYNYTRHTSFDLAQVEFHYLHNTDPGYVSGPGCLASPRYGDCLALSNDLTEGRFSLMTEVFWGDGKLGKADVFGLSLLPTWYLAEKWQLVGLLELAGSAGDNGLVLPTRYEAKAPGTGDKSGDPYCAGYLGLNYYLYGHKLKLMSGVKYSYLDGGTGGGDFNGWTGLVGLRMGF